MTHDSTFRPFRPRCETLEVRNLLTIQFPADAGVLNVTDYGAVPDDGLDDTAAIQGVLNSISSGNYIIYFPPGTYDISNRLMLAGTQKRNILQGAGRYETVLRLMDSVPADYSGAVIQLAQGQSAQQFRNAVRDMTISVGVGHPNAIGLRFWANNQGVARDLDIVSEDLQGDIGLDMGFDDEIGPLLVKSVNVVGFRTGVVTRWQTASQTFEDLGLYYQSEVGWLNLNTQTVFARNVFSYGSVTAIHNTSEARMVLVGGYLQGEGGAATQTALRNQKSLYVRDLTTSGFRNAVSNELNAFRGNHGLPDGYVEEYWANGPSDSFRGGTFELFEGTPDTMLRLPILDSPELPWDDPKGWISPLAFGGLPDDSIDDTAAIQAAIDYGLPTVYLPRGTWQINGTVELRGAVRRLLGTEAFVRGGGAFRLVDGDEPVVAVERMEVPVGQRLFLEHASGRTLVVNQFTGVDYRALAEFPGNLFLNDVVADSLTVRNQYVAARQLNLEGNNTKVINDAAQVWILGMKTEGTGTLVRTINGGLTELLGTLKVGSGQTPGTNPAFVTEESFLSVAGYHITPGSGGWDVAARETRDGVTRTAVSLSNADVYSAFPAWLLTGSEVYLDNADPTGVRRSGTWTATAGYQGGFVGLDFLFAAPAAGATITFTPDLALAGTYLVYARWINDASGQSHAGHATNAPFDIVHVGGTARVTRDQRTGGGQWNLLGLFEFAAGTEGSVTLGSAGANGNVLADGVRFVHVPSGGPGGGSSPGRGGDGAAASLLEFLARRKSRADG